MYRATGASVRFLVPAAARCAVLYRAVARSTSRGADFYGAPSVVPELPGIPSRFPVRRNPTGPGWFSLLFELFSVVLIPPFSLGFIRTGKDGGVLMNSSGVAGVTLTYQHGMQKVMGLAE